MEESIMPRLYPPDQKTAALVLLERNQGNVQLVAEQMGIPESTLYEWSRSIRQWLGQNPLTAPPPIELPTFNDDLEALSFIRQNIITELSRLSASLQYDPGFSTPYQRALVLSQLMDKLLKLDGHLKPYMDDDDYVWELSDDVEEVDDEDYA
jgi:transposase-like protein